MKATRLLSLVLTVFTVSLPLAGAQTLRLRDSGDDLVRAMPSEEAQTESPRDRAYAKALQAWLDENPDVNIEVIEFDSGDQQALVTGIAGGTAPAIYFCGALGDSQLEATRTAFAQGLAADVTEYIEQYDVLGRLNEPLPPLFREGAELDGSFYGLPGPTVGVNPVVYYRKDLIREAGLGEPQAHWTWDDFRELAGALTTPEHKGAILPVWVPNAELNTGEYEILAQSPAPETNWNWRWDYTENLDRTGEVIEGWRGALYENQSIIMDPTIPDFDTFTRFADGEAAMAVQSAIFYTLQPGVPFSMSALADRVGKPVDEVAGIVRMPGGALGQPSESSASLGAVCFNPDMSAAELAAAVDLYHFMAFGEGDTIIRQTLWEETEDPRFVFDAVILPVMGDGTVPGVPASLEDVWGEDFLSTVEGIASIPRTPAEALYFPAQAQGGPSRQAFEDALNTLLFTAGDVDIEGQLSRASEVRNQQAESFSSEVSDEVFLEAAGEYYRDLTAFYRENAPEFYTQVYEPWFEENVASVLGQ